MAGTFETSTWSVQKDWGHAKLFFEIPNFSAVRVNTINGQVVASKPILIGRSRFSAKVCPSGAGAAGMIGVFLQNEGKHSVVVDYTATVGEKIRSKFYCKIEVQQECGWYDFMNISEVCHSPQGSLVLSMEIKLMKEEINGALGESVNKSFISIKEDVVACPDCKLAFPGRDMGMEACVQNMTEGSSARRKEDLILKKIKTVVEELKADVKNVEVKLREDFVKEAKSIEATLKAEVVNVSTATDGLKEMIKNHEVKLRSDLLEEINNVQKNLKAEIVKVKTPAAEFIPECPICLHQMVPPTKIVHCVKGHKLCETCSKKEAVKSCPSCKTAFMGRDFGMEAFIRELAGEK